MECNIGQDAICLTHSEMLYFLYTCILIKKDQEKISANITFLFYKEIYKKYLILYYKLLYSYLNIDNRESQICTFLHHWNFYLDTHIHPHTISEGTSNGYCKDTFNKQVLLQFFSSCCSFVFFCPNFTQELNRVPRFPFQKNVYMYISH